MSNRPQLRQSANPRRILLIPGLRQEFFKCTVRYFSHVGIVQMAAQFFGAIYLLGEGTGHLFLNSNSDPRILVVIKTNGLYAKFSLGSSRSRRFGVLWYEFFWKVVLPIERLITYQSPLFFWWSSSSDGACLS